MKYYTVRDLIKKLNKIEDKDKDCIVLLEGCDCMGKWNGKYEVYENKDLVDFYENPEIRELCLTRDE